MKECDLNFDMNDKTLSGNNPLLMAKVGFPFIFKHTVHVSCTKLAERLLGLIYKKHTTHTWEWNIHKFECILLDKRLHMEMPMSCWETVHYAKKNLALYVSHTGKSVD